MSSRRRERLPLHQLVTRACGARPTRGQSVQTKIIPNLWFDTQAEEAANYYVSVF